MSHTSNITSLSGLDLIHSEMARQHGDALASFEAASDVAKEVAASIKRTGRLALIGMGGSHCMNRTVEAIYRSCGVDARAIIASEQLYQPVPAIENWTRILTSQSGESAEIVRMLDVQGAPDTYGLTLNAKSRLGQAIPILLGVGGPEIAYAATRSLLITLALHAAVLEELGANQDALRAILSNPVVPDITAALKPLSQVGSIIFSGREALTGVAEAGALGLLELARMPGFAFEGGQFRHGPVEVLTPDIGVVLLRAESITAPLTAGLAKICVSAGITPVILDASSHDDLPGCVTIRLPSSTGLSAAMAILPALQTLLVEVAKTRVENVGVPVRSTKITDIE